MKVRAFAVAALLSVAMPAAVLAQNASPDASQKGIVTGSDVNAGSAMSSSGSMSATTDFNAFLQGLETADYTSATGDLPTATSFKVVKLSSLQNADANKLQEVIGPHQQDIASLTTWIDGNAQAKAALDEQNVASNDVVWAAPDDNGVVTLFVNDLGAGGGMSGGAMGSGSSGSSSGAMSGGAATKSQ